MLVILCLVELCINLAIAKPNLTWVAVLGIRKMRKVADGQPWNNFRLSALFRKCRPIEDLMKNINTWMSTDNHKSEMRLSANCLGCQDAQNHLFLTLHGCLGPSPNYQLSSLNYCFSDWCK